MAFSSFLAILVLCSGAYYVIVQIALVVGMRRLGKCPGASKPFISVVVAARNEQHTIGGLLEVLVDQTYPSYEIVIVDDRSGDSTAQIVRSFQTTTSQVKLVTVDAVSNDMPAKKNALTLGIRASKGEILCFTDADCLPTRSWIASLVDCFDDNVGVVAGYSPYDASMLPTEIRPGFGQKLLLEFIAGEEFKGAMWSAGAIGMNCAWLCTGRNLAYRRSVFEQVGGFEKIKMSVSGDDDLFIQIVRRLTQWKIRYVTSHDSHVRTAPPSSFSRFVEQRTRHFSSGKYFTVPMKMFFFFFHASNLILFVGLFASFFSARLALYAIPAFLFKLGCDLLLTLVSTRKLLGERIRGHFRFSGFLFTEISYILYNTFIGPLGFLRTFHWKPDEIKTTPDTNPV